MSNEDIPQSNIVTRTEGCYISRDAIENVRVRDDGAIMIILKPSLDGSALFAKIDRELKRKARENIMGGENFE